MDTMQPALQDAKLGATTAVQHRRRAPGTLAPMIRNAQGLLTPKPAKKSAGPMRPRHSGQNRTKSSSLCLKSKLGNSQGGRSAAKASATDAVHGSKRAASAGAKQALATVSAASMLSNQRSAPAASSLAALLAFSAKPHGAELSSVASPAPEIRVQRGDKHTAGTCTADPAETAAAAPSAPVPIQTDCSASPSTHRTNQETPKDAAEPAKPSSGPHSISIQCSAPPQIDSGVEPVASDGACNDAVPAHDEVLLAGSPPSVADAGTAMRVPEQASPRRSVEQLSSAGDQLPVKTALPNRAAVSAAQGAKARGPVLHAAQPATNDAAQRSAGAALIEHTTAEPSAACLMETGMQHSRVHTGVRAAVPLPAAESADTSAAKNATEPNEANAAVAAHVSVPKMVPGSSLHSQQVNGHAAEPTKALTAAASKLQEHLNAQPDQRIRPKPASAQPDAPHTSAALQPTPQCKPTQTQPSGNASRAAQRCGERPPQSKCADAASPGHAANNSAGGKHLGRRHRAKALDAPQQNQDSAQPAVRAEQPMHDAVNVLQEVQRGQVQRAADVFRRRGKLARTEHAAGSTASAANSHAWMSKSVGSKRSRPTAAAAHCDAHTQKHNASARSTAQTFGTRHSARTEAHESSQLTAHGDKGQARQPRNSETKLQGPAQPSTRHTPNSACMEYNTERRPSASIDTLPRVQMSPGAKAAAAAHRASFNSSPALDFQAPVSRALMHRLRGNAERNITCNSSASAFGAHSHQAKSARLTATSRGSMPQQAGIAPSKNAGEKAGMVAPPVQSKPASTQQNSEVVDLLSSPDLSPEKPAQKSKHSLPKVSTPAKPAAPAAPGRNEHVGSEQTAEQVHSPARCDRQQVLPGLSGADTAAAAADNTAVAAHQHACEPTSTSQQLERSDSEGLNATPPASPAPVGPASAPSAALPSPKWPWERIAMQKVRLVCSICLGYFVRHTTVIASDKTTATCQC